MHNKELDFLKLAEKLKLELRHSWLSDGLRQESVAEHSWRLALMAFRYSNKLEAAGNDIIKIKQSAKEEETSNLVT